MMKFLIPGHKHALIGSQKQYRSYLHEQLEEQRY